MAAVLALTKAFQVQYGNLASAPVSLPAEREFFIDNLLVRIHRCFWWTGLAPWEFEFPFPGSFISTLVRVVVVE
jgi:hypothetical protein